MSTLTNRAEARTTRNRGSKSADAYRTISEVANGLDVPQHVLRFWETRFSQIRPLKRGGGRRYYRPEDVNLLRGIRHLLYEEGYTIKGVQKVIKERGAKAVVKIGRDTIATEAPAPVVTATTVEPDVVDPIDADTRRQLETLLTELVDIRGELKS